jgi:hypothetical protein
MPKIEQAVGSHLSLVYYPVEMVIIDHVLGYSFTRVVHGDVISPVHVVVSHEIPLIETRVHDPGGLFDEGQLSVDFSCGNSYGEMHCRVEGSYMLNQIGIGIALVRPFG